MENNLNVEIVERDPKSFAFHPSNPRDHSDESVARLAESIQEDPLYFRGRPILLSDRTGELVVIGGEGRTRAAILLGLDFVPSVVFHGLTEEDEVRIMQKDNSHTGKWDDAKLQELADKWGEDKIKSWGVDGWKKPTEMPIVFDASPKQKPYVCKITFEKVSDMMVFVQKYKNEIESEFDCVMSESGGGL